MKKTVKQLDTFLRKTPKLGKGVYLAKTAVVLGDVTLGAHSSVWYGAVLRGDINRIVVGHHSNIQDNAVLHLADVLPCIVGNWVTVGHGGRRPCLQGRRRSARGHGRGDSGRRGHWQTIHHRREGAGDAGNENSARLTCSRRACKNHSQADKEGTRHAQMVGEKLRENGAYCLKHGINVGGAKEPLPQVRVFKRKAKLQ